ncbi:MAG: hypothetical protein NTZ92_05430 [Candidatus Omnitrophica bacterium]|nr:hypothetical protein [Candidatus Omnitrophota bacterium]
MRRMIVIGFCLISVFCLFSGTVLAAEKETNAIVEQLNVELEKAKVFVPQELKSIDKPMKNMVDKGATKDELKKVLTDLANAGAKGGTLKSSVESMNDLVNSGEKPKEAGNIVSQAAHQAKAAGLKGKDLAAKVHEAIKQRKAEKDKLKKEEKVENREKKEKKEKDQEKSKGSSESKGKGKK